jgi:small subunit ribosomal protein S4
MSRARLKRVRRLGTPLPGLTRKEVRPGAASGRPRRVSDYRRRLEEKQKVRFHYGVSEAQLRQVHRRALRAAGPTGEVLLEELERRLDSVVFRLGFAPTIRAARRLVGHGHVRVDGARVDRPGYRLRSGQAVSLSDRAHAIPDVAAALERGPEVRLPRFLALETPSLGRMMGTPSRSDAPFLVDETAIVEFYAR